VANPNIYTVGGTIQPNRLYIPRQADANLLTLCQENSFVYILTPRQMGKSSLMVRTTKELAKEGIHSVIIDLTLLGAHVSPEEWYLGLLMIVQDNLQLETDVVNWWQIHSHLGFTQRLTRFFQRVLLAEKKGQTVIFIDEIDTTLSLDFTDDFYAAIRSLYNARAYDPQLSRLSFVLIGVATPSDLIRDPRRTPFNIGHRLDLADFSFEEALPLADGFGLPSDEAKQVLQWVMQWTRGHPYLTQRLCQTIAQQHEHWSRKKVDLIVADTVLGEKAKQDHNLQFVRDMLTKRTPDRLGVLTTYQEIRLGEEPIYDEEHSTIKSHLKLSGIVRLENDILQVRNPIYEYVFNRQWIEEVKSELLDGVLETTKPAVASLPQESTVRSQKKNKIGLRFLPELDNIIGGSYQLEEEIGKTDCAAVFKASHPGFGRIAIKVLSPSLAAQDPNFVKQFLDKMTLIGKMSLPNPHPNILPVHDFGVDREYCYIVMGYVENWEILTQTMGQSLSYKQAIDLANQMADALIFAHERGVIHGNVRPSNIFIRSNRILLSDFGVPLIAQNSLSLQENLVGQSIYIAPEQLKGKEIDERTDVYALGTILYQMLTNLSKNQASVSIVGHHSWKADTPERVRKVILRARSTNPNKRYATIPNFITALRQAERDPIRLRFQILPPFFKAKLLNVLFYLMVLIIFALLIVVIVLLNQNG